LEIDLARPATTGPRSTQIS